MHAGGPIFVRVLKDNVVANLPMLAAFLQKNKIIGACRSSSLFVNHVFPDITVISNPTFLCILKSLLS